MTEQQNKLNGIEAINQQLSVLNEQAKKAISESKVHVEKRDKLNEQFRLLRQEINALKAERDQLNEQVKTLKGQRDAIREQGRAIIEEMKVHIQKITELKQRRPRERRQDLQKEFNAIEWKIQTTSLDLHEEKRLIENVKQIEGLLSVYKKIDTQNQKIRELKAQLEPFKTQSDAIHQEVTNLAKRSQDIHATMIAKINEAKNVRAEANTLHKAYLEARGKVPPIREETKKLFEQKQILLLQQREQIGRNRKESEVLREEEAKKKEALEQDLKTKLGDQARGKLERGERLSWQEFQLLAGPEDEPEAED